MKTENMIIMAAAVILAATVGLTGWMSSSQGIQRACTEEAKVCPDGSAVGRTGPNCEFAPCPTVVGGDRDIHGCIGSAGYSWCEIKQKCIRSWEENCTAKPLTGFPLGWGLGYKVVENTTKECGSDDECETPGRYMVLSSCPYNSRCIRGLCAVVCPEENDSSLPDTTGQEGTICTPESRKGGVCTKEYHPVCGWFNESIKCFRYPCANIYSNPCMACSDPKVKSYTTGECPEGINPTTTTLKPIGGDLDEHGCLVAAGYSWNDSVGVCMRQWSGETQCGPCPQYSPPAPGWCANGTIVSGKVNECGCRGPPQCLTNNGMGILKGRITIGPLCPVETNPPQPQCLPTIETYTAHKVIIYKNDIAVGELIRDSEGRFELSLSPGTYRLETVRRGIGGMEPITVNIKASQTTEQDVAIDTGIR